MIKKHSAKRIYGQKSIVEDGSKVYSYLLPQSRLVSLGSKVKYCTVTMYVCLYDAAGMTTIVPAMASQDL